MRHNKVLIALLSVHRLNQHATHRIIAGALHLG